MVPVKVRKRDKELSTLAPSIRVLVDIVEKLIVDILGPEYAVDHKINLYMGEKQRFANNPRSKKMYIQYDENLHIDNDPDSEIQNLFISGVLHEIGHSYLKIENSLKRAKESIASEGLANIFGLIFMDEACSKLEKDSFLIKNNYLGREKQWFIDLFNSKKDLPCPMEATRFFYKKLDKDKLLTLIKAFNLRHKTYMQFEKILEERFGEKLKADYAKLIESFDLDAYARKYNRKV
jgi:hypothetical protein